MPESDIDFVLQVRARVNTLLDDLGELEKFVINHEREREIKADPIHVVEAQEPVVVPNRVVSPHNFCIDREDPTWDKIPIVSRPVPDTDQVKDGPQFSVAAGLEVVNALRYRQGFMGTAMGTSNEFTAKGLAKAIHRSDSGVRHILKYLGNGDLGGFFVRQSGRTHLKARIWELVA